MFCDNTRRKLEYTRMFFKFYVNGVALVDLLNSLDRGSCAKLAIVAWTFLIMIRTTKSCKRVAVVGLVLALLLFFHALRQNDRINQLHSQHILPALDFSFCAQLIPLKLWLFYSLSLFSVFYLHSLAVLFVTTRFLLGYSLLSSLFLCVSFLPGPAGYKLPCLFLSFQCLVSRAPRAAVLKSLS